MLSMLAHKGRERGCVTVRHCGIQQFLTAIATPSSHAEQEALRDRILTSQEELAAKRGEGSDGV